jgi:ergothioneine biosynthesis protein EgtB
MTEAAALVSNDVKSDNLLYCDVRTITERLAEPLTPEDQTVQSMPDVSPTKWHRAHVTWFFETFVLGLHQPGYQTYDDRFQYLFNSYYEAVGARHPRTDRGLLSRPSADEIGRYRRFVDEAMVLFQSTDLPDEVRWLIQLGLHHEQQHQELLVMDAKNVLSRNPLQPVYGPLPWPAAGAGVAGWADHEGGIVSLGHDGDGFSFDNEEPRHDLLLRPFRISEQLVTNEDWLAFMADGGYQRVELWMSEGWSVVQADHWRGPLYWRRADGAPLDGPGGSTSPDSTGAARAEAPLMFTLDGLGPIDRAAPVDHVSWFEADAYARWCGGRLPLEAEWEVAAPEPSEHRAAAGWYGSVWQWTASPYSPYPGFVPPPGAVGEYNGKFMINQQVLRGSSWATPPGHARRTYRNFFPTAARWCVGGLRVAYDQ